MKWLLISILAVTFIACNHNDIDDAKVSAILFDKEYLIQTKSRIQKSDLELQPALKDLISSADKALMEGSYTVTDKEKLAPSGDVHDYASYSRYWWPDPSKPDGLPYIRKDGITYPNSQSLEESDRQRIGALGKNAETLGLAYYFTNDEKYAKKAAELLRVWFLDEATRMNPNVNHAQIRPGHNDGTKSGVLDGRLMIRALEGSLLIAGSSQLSSTEMQGLKAWAAEYYTWLTTNKRALEESKSGNNHGSYYDVQALYFALYSENFDGAKRIANNFIDNRINAQIEPNGSMPEEMARTRPLFYSIYNLNAMFIVAHLAEQVEVDIWHHTNSRLRTALDYLAPYADVDKQWPSKTIKKEDRMELFSVLKKAEAVYPDGNYSVMTQKLSNERQLIHRANLAYPVLP